MNINPLDSIIQATIKGVDDGFWLGRKDILLYSDDPSLSEAYNRGFEQGEFLFNNYVDKYNQSIRSD